MTKLVTHVQFDVPLEFVVISYFPGSFGSILYHSLNTAPELGGIFSKNIFVAHDGSSTNGGAHNVGCEIFDKLKGLPHGVFHDGEEVDPWISASDSYRRQYLRDNLNYTKAQQLKELNPNRKYYMHRWVVPNAEHLVSKYLNSRIVGVILEDDIDLDITVKMHVKKSLMINQETNIIPKLEKNNPMMKKIYEKLSEEQKIKYLTKISHDRITKINGIRSYDVGIRLKDFLDHDRYLTRIKEISRFLNIHTDYEKVEEIYKDFHTINQIDRIRYDHSI
jgi:hypothetical protein